MTTPTAAERLLLDTEPQRTQLYLSIFNPDIALMCQVNGTYSVETQSVGFDNTVSGSYLNVGDYYYQVALIGTTPGDDDVGRTWVRSITSNLIRFVESDHINWQNDLYITVLRYTEIIPVFPRITQNPADEEDVIFYKVWDVPYTNQNETLGTFINMGSNFAGFLDGGSGVCYWSASGTSNLLGNSLLYSWSFEGATVTGSTSHTPGNVTWSQPGNYRVILTVADTVTSRLDTSIRYVSWYHRPGEGNRPPISNFEFSEFGGSRDGVGYTARVRVRESIPENTVRDGALVVIFKEDWYGTTKQSISNNDKGREGILFSGYINGGTIQYNYADGYVEFELVSPTNLMELTECFSVSVESKVGPTTWYELLNMNVSRALYHYYAWHSTVLMCCDFSTKNLEDRNIQFFDADRTSLYDAGNSLVDGALRGRIISDSLGHIWVERDVSVIDSASTVLDTDLVIEKKDWKETPVFDERHVADIAFIESGGIYYEPASGESVPLLAGAPGAAPGYHGTVDRVQGFALSGQADLNTMTGNMYAYRNSRYPNVDIRLRGNFSNLDIAPQRQVKLNIAQNDTPRRITFINKSFAIRSISWSWDSRAQRLSPSLTLSEITTGFAATSIIIPVEPPDDGDDGGSGNQPPVNVPPIPAPTPVVPGTTAVDVYENGVFKVTTSKLNFIGSIVHVVANVTEDRADIMFDACGCSGTFNTGDVAVTGGVLNYQRSDSATPDLPEWPSGRFDLICANTGRFGYSCTGPFTIISGSSGSLTVPYSDLYFLDFQSFQFGFKATGPGGTCSYDATATLHVGNWSKSWSVSRSGTIPGGGSVMDIVSAEAFTASDVYLQADDIVMMYIEFEVTVTSGSLNVTHEVQADMDVTITRMVDA